MIRVRISEAMSCLFSLDDPKVCGERGLLLCGSNLTGDRAALDRLAKECDDVAAGLLADATDNPGATKRTAQGLARRIRIALR